MTCIWRKFSRESSDYYTHALLMALPYPDLTTPPTFHRLFFAEMVTTPNHKSTQNLKWGAVAASITFAGSPRSGYSRLRHQEVRCVGTSVLEEYMRVNSSIELKKW